MLMITFLSNKNLGYSRPEVVGGDRPRFAKMQSRVRTKKYWRGGVKGSLRRSYQNCIPATNSKDRSKKMWRFLAGGNEF